MLQKIKNKQLELRKAKHPLATSLTTLLGESLAVGKKANRDPSDAEIIQVTKKFIANIEETLKLVPAGSDRAASLESERDLLKDLLPKQLSTAELRAVVAGEIAALEALKGSKAAENDFGKVMKELKASHEGLFDGGVARLVFIELIKS